MRDTIDMAREAGLLTWLKPPEDVIERFKAFEALVRADERNRTWTQKHWTEYERSIAAAEREACAKVCEQQSLLQLDERVMRGIDACAAAIRARGETK